VAGEHPNVPRLIVLSPVDHDPLELTRSEMIIGRLDTADIVLDDPFVSRRHALITIDPLGEVTIQDLNSTSGTFVNGDRIVEPRVLRPGDQVRLANLETRFEGAAPVARAGETPTVGVAVQPPAPTRADIPVQPSAPTRAEVPASGRQDAETDAGRDLQGEYEHVRAVKRATQARLLMLPGVHAVGVGPKMVNGERTEVPSIMVFTVEKKPLAELPAELVIPGEIDGVRTDVMQMGVPQLLSNPAQQPDLGRERPLLGGIAIHPKGPQSHGTLGCFATTQDNPPKVVAITCQHVAAPVAGNQKSDVHIVDPHQSLTANPYLVTFSVTGQNTAGSVINVRISPDIHTNTFYSAYYTVIPADTPQTIASKVKDAVNAITGADVSATIGTDNQVVITTTQSNAFKFALVYDPPAPDSEAKLYAAIAGNVITLTGRAEGDYGVYTSWNTSGDYPTRGVFTPIKKSTPLGTIAIAIAADITKLINNLDSQNISGITGISAVSNSDTVTINGVQQVSCLVTRDIRVGQPSDDFSSNCSLCCGTDEIGRVLNADISVDTAIVQLRRGIQYLNEIKGDSTYTPPIANIAVNGTRTITDADVHAQLPVHKRGFYTLYTTSKIIASNVGGATAENQPQWSVFYRYYDDGIAIQMDPAPNEFDDSGDSGAAVFDDAGNVVGILFGGRTKIFPENSQGPPVPASIMTPIDAITKALEITVAIAQGPQTVTDAQGAPAVVMRDEGEALPQLLNAQAEIMATPTGKKYAELVGRHAGEVQALVNNNLRVAVVWHRNSGPDIVQALFRMVQSPDQRLPEEIDGVPVAERLTRIRDALIRYGSDELTEDLSRYSAELLRLTSLTYREALAVLRTGDAR
jgi:FHA domain